MLSDRIYYLIIFFICDYETLESDINATLAEANQKKELTL